MGWVGQYTVYSVCGRRWDDVRVVLGSHLSLLWCIACPLTRPLTPPTDPLTRPLLPLPLLQVWFVKFSNDGKRLASGSKDGELIIWNVEVSWCVAHYDSRLLV